MISNKDSPSDSNADDEFNVSDFDDFAKQLNPDSVKEQILTQEQKPKLELKNQLLDLIEEFILTYNHL